jgi:phage terminase Nu1 subunit (DNA packaging protein)
MGKIVNQAELALLLGKSDVTIWEWQKEGLPIARQGVRGTEHQYDSAEVIDWLVKRELARAGKGEKASEREARLRGDVLELELQVKRERPRAVHGGAADLGGPGSCRGCVHALARIAVGRRP